MTDLPAEVNAETFRPYLGTTFQVTASQGACELLLAAVDACPEQPGAPRVQPFSLTFTAPPGVGLPQGIFRLMHAELGALEIFLVPRQPLPDGLSRYEAVFN